ncbi:hypothetical protein [Akkermansia sp.]|uniref:hypothetical protein n=1 Tax=Akkermansia sp. TaxID=1872421 RepID=UPI0025BC6339|nr:hypothetical protein [Akkermansia sp.]
MDIKKCKVGTRVQFNGTIIPGVNDIVSVYVRSDDGEEHYINTRLIKPATPHYDLKRKYRKGDLVRITGFHGRLFGNGDARELGENNKIGTQVTLFRDEDEAGDVCLPDGVLLYGNNWLSVACVELVKPIEETEKEDPYLVDAGAAERRNGGIVVVFSYEKHGRDNANRMAQKVCDELNREYKKFKNR